MLRDDFGKVSCREERTVCTDISGFDRAKYPNIEQAGKGKIKTQTEFPIPTSQNMISGYNMLISSVYEEANERFQPKGLIFSAFSKERPHDTCILRLVVSVVFVN